MLRIFFASVFAFSVALFSSSTPLIPIVVSIFGLGLYMESGRRLQVVAVLSAALLAGADGLWAAAVRGAILLGETPRARAELQERLSGDPDPDVVRRAIVETILHGDRTKLVKTLDESILGLRPAPTRHIAVADTRALAG